MSEPALSAPRRALHAIRQGAHRVDTATPASRDRAVDALRAFAILGVVLGHWLVTALVADDGTLHTASPLQHLPWLAPVSWAFQTLAVFFLVGGHVATRSHAAARARGVPYGAWLRTRLARLLGPVLALLTLWTVAATALLLSGTPFGTLHTLVKLALSPLWFLLVFAALTAATPLVARLSPLWPLAVVLHVDVLRFGLHLGPSWLGWVNLAAGWLVPYTLGAAWTRGELETRRAAWVLLLGGTTATVALVTGAGYPASMVGVPGAPVSNLNPPTLAAVTFGLAQCGLALLLRDRLRRAMRRPLVWAAVALVNLSAMTIFLWHQTALMATTATALLAGRLPGLHTLPDSLGWVAARLLWLPVFTLVLALCWTAFRWCEQGTRRRLPGTGGPAARRRSRVVRVHRAADGETARAVRRVSRAIRRV
ncbi:acyltransferase [Streptomyces cellostaticus]|uniref:Acyltransferase n=1 Tax=Streptomyces cellostaticus TaxID=67285 RepID=A0A117PUS4_9ACTN|nr:acyltransferase [Streptomyces cellostaticus]KUM93065.1 acyltransferase [Streptomyces cellostaticus]GHI06093.1 acyltransferase [Streptomyces cellostaticus]